MSSREALRLAEEQDLDLVKIAAGSGVPVCKIMDYGKYKFEMLKKQKEAKKNQKVVELKEVWLSMTIDVGDLNVKARQTQKFLLAGNKVKVSIRMRGRQNAHSALGVDVMNRFFELVKDVAVMEKRERLRDTARTRAISLAKNPPREREDSEPELTFRLLRKRPLRVLSPIKRNKGDERICVLKEV